jgi:two-component system, chemotaxis family, sensor kinase CheA
MSGFGDAFLGDYFAECEEHLASVRHGLLALEKSVGQPRPDTSVTEELFRGYHSLKGLAGMVEDRRGELLAHEMESYLRAVRDSEVSLTTDGVEALIEGTRYLEETVAAMHGRREPPESHEAVAALRRLSGGTSLSAPRHATVGDVATLARGPVTECVFNPSPELNARGVNVDTIRARLRALGEIIRATPLVAQDGGVAFRFLVAASFDAAIAEALRADGLVCTAIEPADGKTIDDEDIAAAGSLTTVAAATAGHYVRVDLGRLDDLMRMIGDLVILRARLSDALGRIEHHVPSLEWRPIQENATGIERQLRELRDGVMRVRLVPVGEIFRRMPFVVRDLARETNRRVQVVVKGQETQIDKFLVERMMDPILHLVRNAVSHGLEPADERVALGKPPDVGGRRDGHARGVRRWPRDRCVEGAFTGTAGGARGASGSDVRRDCAPGFDLRSRVLDQGQIRPGERSWLRHGRRTQDRSGARRHPPARLDTWHGHAIHHRVAADTGDHRCAHRVHRHADVRRSSKRRA